MLLTQCLKDILQKENKTNCYYAGAGLYIDIENGKGYFHLVPNSILGDDPAYLVYFEEGWNLDFKLSQEQKLLAAQIYVEYKTEGCFYDAMSSFLSN